MKLKYALRMSQRTAQRSYPLEVVRYYWVAIGDTSIGRLYDAVYTYILRKGAYYAYTSGGLCSDLILVSVYCIFLNKWTLLYGQSAVL